MWTTLLNVLQFVPRNFVSGLVLETSRIRLCGFIPPLEFRVSVPFSTHCGHKLVC
jgi:hypothetical protein